MTEQLHRLEGELRQRQDELLQQHWEWQQQQQGQLQVVGEEMRTETDRVLALNLQKVEEVAKEELDMAVEEMLGELMEQAAGAPRGPEVPKNPNLRSRSAKKS